MNNSIVKELDIRSKDGNNVRINNIFHAGGKNILVCTNNSVILYDAENRQVVEELYCVGVRQIVWNSDYSSLALLSNKSLPTLIIDIVFSTKFLAQTATIYESIKMWLLLSVAIKMLFI